MTGHRYAVGEMITFTNEVRKREAAAGRYRIIALRPESDGEPWYVIRSELERHDRVAAESDLQ